MTRKPQDPSPRRRHRAGWWLLGLALPLALLGAGHAVLWRLAAQRLEAGFHAWAEARRAQGWQVAHGPPSPGGWPLAATLALPAPRVAVPGAAGWQAEALMLRVRLLRPGTLEAEPEGRQSLRLGGAILPFAAGRILATLPLEAGRAPDRATVTATQLRIGTGAEATAVEAASAHLATAPDAREGEAALTLSLSLDGVMLPLATPLGRQVEAATLEAVMTGPLPGPSLLPARAMQWRDSGGALEVRALTLRAGEVAASAAATLVLDAALQPMGAGTLRIAGAPRLLEALGAAGLVPPRTATLARGLLPLLSRPDPETGQPTLEVPVTLENRTLSAARIPLARLPALALPE
ncbi:DUF2125 domain-containing protein [Teichococcus aestuarii]|uniref:DUF2125 domain-containing protein n=1 Tax=Teichococcus aestuarii TaxID=568898 RepID=A0A2U1V4X2_9PROT|nr:DUF2125 domain-containing protein [Pseudoroseomonas aestuarii]PWC28978.1 hypothetical protein CR165_10300 [Pseudoroseomonas aestuarii]